MQPFPGGLSRSLSVPVGHHLSESTCCTRDTLWSCKIKPGCSLNSSHSGPEITQGQWSCWRGHCVLGSTSAPLLISCCFTESYTLFRWHMMGKSESWQRRGDTFLTSSTHEPWWACKVLCCYKLNTQITKATLHRQQINPLQTDHELSEDWSCPEARKD